MKKLMTAEEFDALPEEEIRNWELLDGELIEVSSATPEHNLILAQLLSLLHVYVRKRKLGVVLPKTDLAVGNDTRLRPDLSYFSTETWRTVDVKQIPVVEPPEIAIEIIPPSENETMTNRKLDAYLTWRIREVWLIYPEPRMVLQHTGVRTQRLSEDAQLNSDLIPGFRVQIADLFEDL